MILLPEIILRTLLIIKLDINKATHADWGDAESWRAAPTPLQSQLTPHACSDLPSVCQPAAAVWLISAAAAAGCCCTVAQPRWGGNREDSGSVEDGITQRNPSMVFIWSITWTLLREKKNPACHSVREVAPDRILLERVSPDQVRRHSLNLPGMMIPAYFSQVEVWI